MRTFGRAARLALPVMLGGSLLAGASLLRGANPPGVAAAPVAAATTAGPPRSYVKHPDWSRDASIYEVNLRQYSRGGTFKEFEQHLPRLKGMGVKILWLMPIYPIGEKNRKGTLGSYYSVRDYLAVNPEFGTLEDLKHLVKAIHAQGMYVIIDWVADHTAWDNPLTIQHADWYTRDAAGNFKPPVPDWTDVIGLNYGSAELRRYMIDAMKFWITECDIDGFRCDVAEMVPLDFWVAARAELEQAKPVFMLAEGESPALEERAFDATYGWDLFKVMRGIAGGSKTVADLRTYLDDDAARHPTDAYRMYFTSNHDENSWNGTAYEMFGDGVRAFAVLALTLKGIPMVYSGQEAGLKKRLAFFDKDSIAWTGDDFAKLYKVLLNLKQTNLALWNGDSAGPVERVKTSNDAAVFAFVRERGEDRVVVVLNLSERTQNVELRGTNFAGVYADVFTGGQKALRDGDWLKLKPWEYAVYASAASRLAPR